jgi:hypothetical protein
MPQRSTLLKPRPTTNSPFHLCTPARQRVRDYLEKHGAGECVLWEEHAPHGAVLFEKAKLSRVIECVLPWTLAISHGPKSLS